MTQAQETGEGRGRNWFVRLAIIAALGTFVLSLALIYQRYMTTPETNCSVFVHGKPYLDGMVVRVQRLSGSAHGPKFLSDTISEINGYTARFFLPSGTYRVDVWDEKDEPALLWSETTFISPGVRLSMDLTKRYPDPNDPQPDSRTPRRQVDQTRH